LTARVLITWDCEALQFLSKFLSLEKKSGRLHVILSISTPWWEFAKREENETNQTGRHGGIDELVAGPRGRISGPLEDMARVKRYKSAHERNSSH